MLVTAPVDDVIGERLGHVERFELVGVSGDLCCHEWKVLCHRSHQHGLRPAESGHGLDGLVGLVDRGLCRVTGLAHGRLEISGRVLRCVLGEDRAVVIKGYIDATATMFGGAVVEEEGDEAEPMGLVCYRIRK